MEKCYTGRLAGDLTSQLNMFQEWLKCNQGPNAIRPENYHGWHSLATAFTCFLRCKNRPDWSNVDEELVVRACRLDWQSRKLFHLLSEAERLELMLLPYSEISARMYMLMCARDCLSIKMDVALSFYSNDEDETIREEALITLAGCLWPEAEGHAVNLWRTRKTVKRIIALTCLHALNSKLLDQFLEKGLSSKSRVLRLGL